MNTDRELHNLKLGIMAGRIDRRAKELAREKGLGENGPAAAECIFEALDEITGRKKKEPQPEQPPERNPHG